MSIEHDLIKGLVQHLLEHPEGADWSVQGLGMMRMYLGPERRLRLNVWDSALQIPNASPIHNHVWDFQSYIVAGRLRQQRYHRDDGAVFVKEFNHTRINPGPGASALDYPDQVKLSPGRTEIYREGQIYRQEKDEIHLTFPEDGTVTIINRTFHPGQDTADIFWEGSGGFVDAAPRAATINEVIDVCQRSLSIWF